MRRLRAALPILAAFVVAASLSFGPEPARTARAAEDLLRSRADATFVVDVEERLVNVEIDWRLTNIRPDALIPANGGTVRRRYYSDGLVFAVPSEATTITAHSGKVRLRTSVRDDGFLRVVTVRYPPLFYQKSRSIRVRFQLPAGRPRSDSDTRVGAAFTTFTAWAWGDPGRSTIRIQLPPAFEEDGFGDDVRIVDKAGSIELRAEGIDEPDEWFRVVVARRPSKLSWTSVAGAGRGVVIRAWPEDQAWRDRVERVMRRGLPALDALIGLDWPLTGELHVIEEHTPLLEGYAGFYDPNSNEITMSEDLDDQTILHEAAHAWFNEALVKDRWILEGLADHYADRARETLGLSDQYEPVETTPRAKGAFPLNDWPDPGRIDDGESEARELFGYDASYTVIRMIAEDIGDDAMRSVLVALDAQHSAYAGDAGPERAGGTGDWRRFLDLVEQIGDTDAIDDLFEEYVVPPSQHHVLRARGSARDAYMRLDEAAEAWAPPVGLRFYMGQWRFDQAMALIRAAEPAVALRDELTGVAADLQLVVPSGYESTFEHAATPRELETLSGGLQDWASAGEALLDTRAAVEAERSPLEDLGLLGESHDSLYHAARAALEAGDADAAMTAATAASAIVSAAESAGFTRAAVIGAVALGILCLLVVAWSLRVRRAKARLVAAGAPTPAASASTTLPATSDPAGARPEVPSPSTEIAPGAEPD